MPSLTEAEIRKLVFDAYRLRPNSSQGDVETYVATHKPQPPQLSATEQATFRRIVWNLALQGVIEPGADGVRTLLHDARLTEYGRTCLQQEQTLPHDPDGYLKALKDCMGGKPDGLIMQYAADALECFHRGNLRAAVVMLGVAAERSLELVKCAYAGSLGEAKSQKAQKGLNDRHLRNRFEYLWKRVAEMHLPDELEDRMEGDFWGTFQLIRRSRNEAGHFTPFETNKLTALACLASFPGFLRTVGALAAHLEGRSPG